MLAWHFLPADMRLANGDRRLVVDGETLTVEGEVVLCKRGLHASESPLDALVWAQGPVLCRVELSGTIVRDIDKAAASSRTCVWHVDATKALRRFAVACARRALEHECAAGREPDLRSWAACDVAERHARGDATDDELAAARDAAWYAAWDVWDAAVDAAWASARAADERAWQESELMRVIDEERGEGGSDG